MWPKSDIDHYLPLEKDYHRNKKVSLLTWVQSYINLIKALQRERTNMVFSVYEPDVSLSTFYLGRARLWIGAAKFALYFNFLHFIFCVKFLSVSAFCLRAKCFSFVILCRCHPSHLLPRQSALLYWCCKTCAVFLLFAFYFLLQIPEHGCVLFMSQLLKFFFYIMQMSPSPPST